MKYVKRVQTSDGKLHLTVTDAKRHADNRYGNAVTTLAHKILRVEKYREAIPFVENVIGDFVELKALRDDLTLAEDDDTEVEYL